MDLMPNSNYMSLKLNNILIILKSLKCVLSEQHNQAITLSARNGEDNPHFLVHEIRKVFKKIQAILRLLRDTTDVYHHQNRFYRDEARKISDIRDATALIEALDVIKIQFEDKLYNKTFTKIRKLLLKRRKELSVNILEEVKILSEIHENLCARYAGLMEISFNIDSYESISPGIKRTYKRGRKALKRANETKKPSDFHEWRKRVKYLRYQLCTINPIWPKFFNTWEYELHELSDFLGTDRDLFMLQNFIREEEKKSLKKEKAYLLNTLIDGHRAQLQEHALLIGNKLYSLSATSFISLIGASWDAEISSKKNSLMPYHRLEK